MPRSIGRASRAAGPSLRPLQLHLYEVRRTIQQHQHIVNTPEEEASLQREIRLRPRGKPNGDFLYNRVAVELHRGIAEGVSAGLMGNVRLSLTWLPIVPKNRPDWGAHYEARTGGGRGVRGVGRRLIVDRNLPAHESAYDFIFLSALGALKRPMSMWRPVPPAGAGMKILLRHAKIGILAERWFSQAELRFSPRNLRYYVLTRYTVGFSRLYGQPLPAPEHTPLEQAVVVARWLAQKTAQGAPAYLEANAGAAVRICVAAKGHGLDISGTLFRIGGEPFTDARARIIAEAGARALCHWCLERALLWLPFGGTRVPPASSWYPKLCSSAGTAGPPRP